MATNISEEMKGLVGRTMETVVSFPIERGEIRRWAMAIYYPDPAPKEYWDESSPEAAAYGGIIAPADFNPFAWMAAERKGPGVTPLAIAPEIAAAGAWEHHLGVAPPDLRKGINGGIEAIAGDVPMRPGDVITTVTAISEYAEREGRLGLMLFITLDHVWTNQRGEHVKTLRTTYIRY